MAARGTFIVIDGGEGSGTTSVSKAAVEALNGEGIEAIWTREPGGSPYAEKIRELILADEAKHADAETMFGLFWAARRDHLLQTVRPALSRGAIVVSDRFDSSTWAYQIVAQEQPQLADLFWKMRAHYLAEVAPDCYIFFDVAPSIGLARAKGRGGKMTHFDERKLEFHNRVREGFRQFTKFVPHRVIDTSAPQAEVLEKTLETIREIKK